MKEAYITEGGSSMIIHNVALVGLIVVSVLLIIVVLLMSGRTTGLGALTGGAEQLFGRPKARGLDAVLNRVASILGALLFILALLVAFYK